MTVSRAGITAVPSALSSAGITVSSAYTSKQHTTFIRVSWQNRQYYQKRIRCGSTGPSAVRQAATYLKHSRQHRTFSSTAATTVPSPPQGTQYLASLQQGAQYHLKRRLQHRPRSNGRAAPAAQPRPRSTGRAEPAAQQRLRSTVVQHRPRSSARAAAPAQQSPRSNRQYYQKRIRCGSTGP